MQLKLGKLKHIGKVSPWRIPSIMANAMADWSKGLLFRVLRVLNALKNRPRMVLDSIEMLFGALFGFLALSGLALSLDGL